MGLLLSSSVGVTSTADCCRCYCFHCFTAFLNFFSIFSSSSHFVLISFDSINHFDVSHRCCWAKWKQLSVDSTLCFHHFYEKNSKNWTFSESHINKWNERKMPSIEIFSCWLDYSEDPHANWMCHLQASHCHFEDFLISNDNLLHAIWTFFNRSWNLKKPQIKSLDNLYTVCIWIAICGFHLWRKCLHLSSTWHTDFLIMIIYDLIFLSYLKWNFSSASMQLWAFNIFECEWQ